MLSQAVTPPGSRRCSAHSPVWLQCHRVVSMQRDWIFNRGSGPRPGGGGRRNNTDLQISDSRRTARRLSAPHKSLHLPNRSKRSAAARRRRSGYRTAADFTSDFHRRHRIEEVRGGSRRERRRGGPATRGRRTGRASSEREARKGSQPNEFKLLSKNKQSKEARPFNSLDGSSGRRRGRPRSESRAHPQSSRPA